MSTENDNCIQNSCTKHFVQLNKVKIKINDDTGYS